MTIAVYALISVIYLAMAVSARAPFFTTEFLIRWGGDYAPRTLNGEWWRLITSTFLHGSGTHIAVNSMTVLVLGVLVERAYGSVAFAAVYLGSGLIASMNSVLWHPAQVSVGASGAIFGLLGFLIPPIAMGELTFKSARVQNPLKVFVLCAVYNLAFGALFPFIDNAAHLGGFVAGLLLGTGFGLFGRRIRLDLES